MTTLVDKSSQVCDKPVIILLMNCPSETSLPMTSASPLRRTFARLFCRIAAISDSLAQRVDESSGPRLTLLVRYWHSIRGDFTLRLNYPLDESAIVFDVGGFEGEWTNNIYAKYRCRIHVFEPVPHFAESIRTRFAGNSRITLHQFGLGGWTRHEKISVQGPGSSIHKADPRAVSVRIEKAGDFLVEHRIDRVALMKINVEGAEYELLDHMIMEDLVSRIGNFQVQFHEIFPDAEHRMHDIQEKLRRTHDLTYQYPFVWENWRLRRF